MGVALATIRGRYDIREILGQGGMGVVYAAYDKVVKRLVAVKTIRDIPDPLALELFQRESQVLADLSHPNIVEMFDIGEFSDDGFTKPYFVMPLLRGATLDHLMMAHDGSLSPARCIDIVSQACRGLHVAHESGLVHRDLKPSNLFVLDDDSVKIIDFGVAHLLSSGTTLGGKGTPHYMAPEQLEIGGASPLSDQFSMAVVAYQLLAGKLPFEGSTARQVARAVLNTVPKPLFEVNPAVSLAVSQVIAKALAKKPAHRFGTIKEFSDSLQRAFLQNKSLPMFDSDQLLPRIERAERALAAGDMAFAEEITAELEDEGSLHPSVTALRRRLDAEKKRSGVERLLGEARHRLRESEYSLALEKVEEALRLDPDHAAAHALRTEIETKRDERLIEQWFQFAERSRERREYDRAQESVARILRLRPENARAQRLLSELKLDEADYRNQCEERDRFYRGGMNAWREGDLTIARNRLERAKQMDPDAESTEIAENFRKLNEEISRLGEARSEIADLLSRGEAAEALVACDAWLQKYPRQPLLQALRLSALETKRQQIATYAAEVDARAAADKDLERRVELFEEAAARYPDEQHFQEALRSARERRDLVVQLRRKAAQFEKSNEWAEALEQWNLIGEIHPEYAQLPENKLRLQKRSHERTEAEEKTRWVRRIDRELESVRFDAALDLIRQARKRFPGDAELDELEKLAETRHARRQQVETLLDRGRALCESGDIEAGSRLLREAREGNTGDPGLGARILQILAREAERLAGTDPAAAGRLVQEAAAIDGKATIVRQLEKQLAENSRDERIASVLARARRHQAEGELPAALVAVQDGLAEFAADPRLESLLATLSRKLDLSRTTYERELEQIEAAIRNSESPAEADRERVQVLMRALGRMRPAERAAESSGGERRRTPSRETASTLTDFAHQLPGETSPPEKAARQRSNSRLFLWAAGVAALAAILSVAVLLLRPGRERSYTPAVIPPPSAAGPAKPEPQPATPPPPSGPPVAVRADSPDYTLSLDGQPDQPLSNSLLDLDRLPAGSHSLAISAADGRKAVFGLDTSGAAAVSAPEISGKGLIGVAAKIAEGTLTLASSEPRLAASLDKSPYSRLGSTFETPLKGSGPHVLTFASGAESWSVPLADEPARQFLAIIHSLKGGSVLINTREDNAEIYIDNVKLRRLTRNGVLRIANLPPHTYTVKVAKDGFEERSGELTVETGKQTTLDLPLKKKAPVVTSLEIKSGTPGAEVNVDGTTVGEIGADGVLPVTHVTPGSHRITIRKPKFVSKSQTYQVEPGGMLALSETDATLEPVAAAPATARFEVTPASAAITLKASAAGNVLPLHTGEPVTVPAGTYEISASAPGFISKDLKVELVSGSTRDFAVHLVPEPARKKADLLAGWEDIGSWSREGDVAVRRGGGMTFYGRTKLAGTIRFKAELRKGRRLEWFLHFKGPDHYCRFEADKQYLYRIEVVNGKATETARKSYSSGDGKTFSVEISIRNGTVVHRINGQTVDTWNDTQRNFTDGSFGFIVPGRSGFGLIGSSEMALRSFSFDPS